MCERNKNSLCLDCSNLLSKLNIVTHFAIVVRNYTKQNLKWWRGWLIDN